MEWYSSEVARPSHKKSDRYLHINNCGFYKGIRQGETVGTFRPFGLPDYQIIYLIEGSMSFLVDGLTKILSAGDIIIYPPDTAQKYKSISESGASYIWVHFTGFAGGGYDFILRAHGRQNLQRVAESVGLFHDYENGGRASH